MWAPELPCVELEEAAHLNLESLSSAGLSEKSLYAMADYEKQNIQFVQPYGYIHGWRICCRFSIQICGWNVHSGASGTESGRNAGDPQDLLRILSSPFISMWVLCRFFRTGIVIGCEFSNHKSAAESLQRTRPV